jgi:hypothetical protein
MSLAVNAQAVGDIVEDREGERIRSLEDHANPPTKQGQAGGGAENIYAIQQHPTGDAHAFDEIVHSIETAKERGFAASRGANDCRNHARLDREVHVQKRTELPIVEV